MPEHGSHPLRLTVHLKFFWLGILCAVACALVGCASGGFMASLSDEELPLEDAPAPYPTAVTQSASQIEMRTMKPADPVAERTDEADAAAPISAEPLQPKSQPIPLRQAPLAPLAMVPSPLRMNRAPDPIPVEMPQPAMAISMLETSAPETSAAHPTSPASDADLPPIVSAEQMRATVTPAAQPSAPSTATDTEPGQVWPSDSASPWTPAGVLVSSAVPQASPPAVAAPTTIEAPSASAIPSADERLSAITQQRDVLIAMLEEDIRSRFQAQPASGSIDPDLGRLEQHLRLLYAMAERPDDAARAIGALSEPEREAYKQMMFGLSNWLTVDEARRTPLRNARVMRSLRDASSELAAASKLDLRNLAFCEKVESFGWFTEFSRNEFQPKQQVVLYVEVDNFVAQEKSPHSFETELQGHYQIFDARGSIVAERKLPLDREVCRNYRRDYFLAYPIYMPEGIAPGRYRLELTVEDHKAGAEYQGRKFGEAMIEFAIRN